MKKSIICKLNIDIELQIPLNIGASSDLDRVEDNIGIIINKLDDSVSLIASNLGFKPLSANPRHISQKNGGYALYSTYMLSENNIQFKLIVDIRVADHPSKPNLAERNTIREDILVNTIPELQSNNSNLALLDMYCKKLDWGIQIYVGKGSEYSEPLTTLESAADVVNAKIKKTLKANMLKAADTILSKYSNDAVILVQEYLDETEDLSVITISDDSWIEDSAEDDLRDLYLTYIETGCEEGYFDSKKQFDEICNALRVVDKYSD